MNIESIPLLQIPTVTHKLHEDALIKLEEIKSILYLGVKGRINIEGFETHQIDTFA